MFICSAAIFAGPLSISQDSVILGIDQAEADRENRLTGYSVIEHYTLRNSRFQTGAEMKVATVYRKGAGKSYRTLLRSGSAALQRTVFDKLLQEQAEMSRGDIRQRALFTSVNYKMKVVGEESIAGKRCVVLDLSPRKKSTHLLMGRAWVDPKDHSLVRIEGKPSASPSFWTGRPMIVREYERVKGFSVVRRSHASTDSFLLGKSELTIEYSDYALTTTN
jgi:hypothetical protein